MVTKGPCVGCVKGHCESNQHGGSKEVSKEGVRDGAIIFLAVGALVERAYKWIAFGFFFW